MNIKHIVSRPFAVALCLLGLLLVGNNSEAAERTAEVSDGEIVEAVENAFAYDSPVGASTIEVSSAEGVVTLVGSVDAVLEKERADKIARSVRGVRSIVNTIQVVPPARPDAAIREDVETALAADPATEGYEIRAAVADGVVTLTGTVESWQEQRLAVFVAKVVKGVRGVESDIEVDYSMDRTDDEVATDVRRVMEIDVWLDESAIEVSVDDGIVTLTGTVGSAAEKARAVTKSLVAGAEEVVAEGLEVEPRADEPMRRDREPVAKPDEWIRQAVADALALDPRVVALELDVSVTNGVVTLFGVVESLGAKRAAERTAENTVGVWKVGNLLNVRHVGDDLIQENVKGALGRNWAVEGFEIEVRVDNGVVTLSGNVDSYFERSMAETVAQNARGVVDVNNDLAVGYPHRTYYDQDLDPLYDLDLY